MAICGLLPMAQTKFTKLNLNRNILTLIGMLALISASIFACKNKKKSAETEPVKIEKQSKSSFVIPKDTATGLVLTNDQFYARTCGNCHQLHEPDEYSNESWKHILDSMQSRAHITDANKASLYLLLTGDTLYKN